MLRSQRKFIEAVIEEVRDAKDVLMPALAIDAPEAPWTAASLEHLRGELDTLDPIIREAAEMVLTFELPFIVEEERLAAEGVTLAADMGRFELAMVEFERAFWDARFAEYEADPARWNLRERPHLRRLRAAPARLGPRAARHPRPRRHQLRGHRPAPGHRPHLRHLQDRHHPPPDPGGAAAEGRGELIAQHRRPGRRARPGRRRRSVVRLAQQLRGGRQPREVGALQPAAALAPEAVAARTRPSAAAQRARRVRPLGQRVAPALVVGPCRAFRPGDDGRGRAQQVGDDRGRRVVVAAPRERRRGVQHEHGAVRRRRYRAQRRRLAPSLAIQARSGWSGRRTPGQAGAATPG
jgi:hypothetical protein